MGKPRLSGHAVAVSSVYLNVGFSRLSRASHGVGASNEVVSLWPTPPVVCRDLTGCKPGQMTLLPAQRAKVRGNGMQTSIRLHLAPVN